MDWLAGILSTYRDYGVAGLFIVFYITTVKAFYKDLKERQKESVVLAEKYATALDQAINALNRTSASMDTVAKSIGESQRQTAEFISFVKGRDSISTGS